MKLGPRDVAGFLSAPPTAVQAVLLFGPDQGLARARRDAILERWLDEPGDPMALTRLSGESLRTDPGSLIDEARSFSMLGGTRAILVSAASDGQASVFGDLLKFETLEAKVIAEAGELNAGSKLRKLFESKPNAVAIGCWPASGAELRSAIEAELRAVGLSADGEAMSMLQGQLGSDRGVIRQEAEKLKLYLGERDWVNADDVSEAVGDSSVMELNSLALLVAAGRVREVDRLTVRLMASKQSPISMLRAVQGQWGRLMRLAAAVETGATPASAVGSARPPIHFKVKDLAVEGLRRRHARSYRKGIQALAIAERQCKTSGYPAGLICHKVLLTLAAEEA